MRRPSRSTFVLGLAALSVAVAQPFVEVIWNCRQGVESSEPCVWGKSLLPLTSTVGLVVVAPVIFGVLLFIRALWRSARARTSTPS
jgi:hypothetical protein